MEVHEKIELLSKDARFEVCGPWDSRQSAPEHDARQWITSTVLAGGRVEPHLKVLLSNACEKDCGYCANRCGRNFERHSFGPEELARAFQEMWRAGLVKGLFLSSAVRGGSALTMEREIATAEILRTKYGFRGYLHLKLMPGTDKASVERAMELADRVSVNLEAPDPAHLARLAGKKDFFRELVTPLRWVAEIRKRKGAGILPSGSTTQFVVGASGESDSEILTTASALYGQFGLARVYYSAFRPVPDTPLQDLPAASPLRELRLYQGDFLLRRYGFTLQELTFDETGNLPLEADPKTLAAVHQGERFPVEVNTASRRELMRVPGIGPRSADRILKMRRQGTFRSLRDLKEAGVSPRRAAPFVLLHGARPVFQPRLF
jgi:predicted DNA-binding helix-hairpin-helix protein